MQSFGAGLIRKKCVRLTELVTKADKENGGNINGTEMRRGMVTSTCMHMHVLL